MFEFFSSYGLSIDEIWWVTSVIKNTVCSWSTKSKICFSKVGKRLLFQRLELDGSILTDEGKINISKKSCQIWKTKLLYDKLARRALNAKLCFSIFLVLKACFNLKIYLNIKADFLYSLLIEIFYTE